MHKALYSWGYQIRGDQLQVYLFRFIVGHWFYLIYWPINLKGHHLVNLRRQWIILNHIGSIILLPSFYKRRLFKYTTKKLKQFTMKFQDSEIPNWSYFQRFSVSKLLIKKEKRFIEENQNSLVKLTIQM